MADYGTKEQVEAYLARIFNPDRRFRISEFEIGWLVRWELTPQEIAAGQAVGLTKLVIDSETGVVTEYPSWSTAMVVEDFREAKRTGRQPRGGQIYPPLWRLSIQRTQESPETIEYQVRVRSLAIPPEENAEYRLGIDKNTLRYPSGLLMAGEVAAWAEARNRWTRAWPDEGTWEV